MECLALLYQEEGHGASASSLVSPTPTYTQWGLLGSLGRWPHAGWHSRQGIPLPCGTQGGEYKELIVHVCVGLKALLQCLQHCLAAYRLFACPRAHSSVSQTVFVQDLELMLLSTTVNKCVKLPSIRIISLQKTEAEVHKHPGFISWKMRKQVWASNEGLSHISWTHQTTTNQWFRLIKLWYTKKRKLEEENVWVAQGE